MIFLVNELLTTDILYSIIHISMTERVYYKQPLWFVLLQSEKKSTTSRPQEAERTTLSILFRTELKEPHFQFCSERIMSQPCIHAAPCHRQRNQNSDNNRNKETFTQLIKQIPTRCPQYFPDTHLLGTDGTREHNQHP